MKDGPVSDDEAIDVLADWTVKLEEADKALKKIPFFENTAKFESAKRRARARMAAKNPDREPTAKSKSNEYRLNEMTDAELRGKLLEHFYNLRHSNGGWVPANDMIFSGGEPVRWGAIAGVCGQLADVGLIEWKPLRGHEGIVAVNAKISGQGVAAVEAGRSSEIDIRFPSKNPTADASMANDPPMSDAALTDIHEAVSSIKAELPALTLSNSEKADIIADIKQIEVETERPTPRRRFMKLYMESLRDNLAKAAGAATAGGLVTLAALVAGLLAKHFGIL
jgi:hypothetical protein